MGMGKFESVLGGYKYKQATLGVAEEIRHCL